MNEESRTQLVEGTIAAFVELVLTQKFADMPDWIAASLTVSQLRAVYHLAFQGSMTVSELATMLKMGRPAASILVQQLVEQELAERVEDTEDRRRAWVNLTPKGIQLVSGRRERREEKFRNWLNQLGDEELNGLLRGISSLMEIIRTDQPALSKPILNRGKGE